jgi:hypothetical protein
MRAIPPPLRRPHRMVGPLQAPLVRHLRPLPLRAARWGLVAAVSVLWVGAALTHPADWASPPRAAWWRTEGLAAVRGLAGAHCAEDNGQAVNCVAYGQGMAFSIEGGGSRVALPMVQGSR